MATNDGGPAFPTHAAYDNQPGMSLRDWLAGQVLSGLFAHGSAKLPFTEGYEKGAEHAALIAYRFADAMLNTRQANGGS